MELPSSKFMISPTLTKFPAKYPRRLGVKFRYSPHTVSSRKSSYQDFQEYAKPSRLLPARGVRLWRDASSLESLLATFSPNESKSLYKVRLQTSKIYGSGLSDVNSGILLCLIGENGYSILQRLPASDDTWPEEFDSLHFQRGSIDEFAFEGPHLGRILAVWISLESGQWRIGGVNVSVFSPSREKNEEIKRLSGLQYEFELEDVLLGEKGDASMIELRPQSVTSFSEDESTLSGEDHPPSASNEESMREYAYLKFSLLFYDTLLILTGSAVASVSIGENAAYAFLFGGLMGFAYLLLLQRSVDQLPNEEVSNSRVFGNLKGSVAIVGLVFALVMVGGKYGLGDDGVKLGSKDLIVGMMGFLMCKISVLLAAFKPISPSFSDNK